MADEAKDEAASKKPPNGEAGGPAAKPDAARPDAAQPRAAEPAAAKPSAAKPSAAQDQAPPDEIAKGLAGLPLNIKGFRAGHDGLQRKGRFVCPWSRVTSVTARGKRVSVEGTNDKGRLKRLLHVKVSAQAARAVESVWTEICFRRVQRDGRLTGGVNAWGLRRTVVFRYLVAAVLILLATYLGHAALSKGRTEASSKASGETRAKASRAGPLASRRGATEALRRARARQHAGTGIITGEWTLPVLLAYLGLGAAAVAVLTHRRTARLAMWWRRWELRAEGLFLWDEDGNGKRLVLSARVVVTPAGLGAADELVSFSELTARPVLSRLFLAMAERAGAAPRTVNLRRFARRLLAALALLAPGPALVAALVRGPEAGAIVLVGLTAAVLVGGVYFCVFGHIRSGKALPQLLADGRSMLRRLGW